MLNTYVAATTQLANLRDRLKKDDSGAALVEYSVLIGIITIGAIASIGTVGTWVAAAWTALVTHMGPNPV